MNLLQGPGSANGLAGAFTLLINYAIWVLWDVAVPNDVTNASQTVINWLLLTWLTIKSVPVYELPKDSIIKEP